MNESIAKAKITAEEAFWIMMPTFHHKRKECTAQIEKWNAEWELDESARPSSGRGYATII